MPLMFFGSQTMAPPTPPGVTGGGIFFTVQTAITGDSDNEAMGAGSDAFPATALGIRVPVGRAGTLRRLTVDGAQNTLNLSNAIIEVLVNGVVSALAVTFAPGQTGVLSDDTPVNVAAEDLISFRLRGDNGASVGVFRSGTTVEFIPS